MGQINIELGVLAPKLTEQLRIQGIVFDKRSIDILQMDADAITRLFLHGFINEATTKSLRKKLIKKIEKHFS